MITSANTQHIPDIQQIAAATWQATYTTILSKEQYAYMMDMMYSHSSLEQQMRLGHCFYLLKEGNQFIGFIDIEKASATLSKLHKIYLLPGRQGRSYGKMLMDFAVEKATEDDSSMLQLNVNRHNRALGFYQKQGFTVVEEVDVPIGNGYFMNDFVMQKRLTQ